MFGSWALLATAQAGVDGSALPAGTVATGDSEFGGGVGGALILPLAVVPVLSGWGRYGVTDRLEAYGGAWLPLRPFDVGLHGGARFAVIGGGDQDGLHLSAGLDVSTSWSLPVAALALSVPARVGASSGPVQVWLGGSAGAYPMLSMVEGVSGTPVVLGAEAGLGVEAGGYPLFLTTGYNTGFFPSWTVMFGFAYRLE